MRDQVDSTCDWVPCEGRRKRDSRRIPQLGGCQETARILFGPCYVWNTLVPHKETWGGGLDRKSGGLGVAGPRWRAKYGSQHGMAFRALRLNETTYQGVSIDRGPWPEGDGNWKCGGPEEGRVNPVKSLG